LGLNWSFLLIQIKSITHQTLLLLVSLTLGLATIFFSLAIVTAFIVEDSVLSNLVDEQAVRIEQHYARYGNLPEIPVGSFKAFAQIGDVPEWARERVTRAQLYGEIFTDSGTHYHYRKLALGNNQQGVLLAEVSNLLVVTNQPGIFGIFCAVFIIAIACAIFLAVKFSRKIVKPILSLTNAVKSNEQLSINAPLPQLEFELGYLSDVLQQSFNKLNLALEREKAFASNVSHELRTPLTVMKNSCCLIEQRGFKAEDCASIKISCERMEHTVDVLLALARAESLAFQSCNILCALEEAVLRCDSLPRENFQVYLSIPHNLTSVANPKLLELLFFNLLRNAAEHASEPSVSVTAEMGQLIFENSIDFCPSYDARQPGRKGADSNGIGQGLYLVSRIADSFGWQLKVENSDKQFRVVILTA
jgi:signal transduction histidine kinase